MKKRRAKKREPFHQGQGYFPRKESGVFIKIASITSASLLLVSGCVVESEAPQKEDTDKDATQTSPPAEQNEEDNKSIASTLTSSTDLGEEIKIKINALERLENGVLRLRIGITNSSSGKFNLYDGLAETGDEQTASRVTLIDTVNQKRYLSLDLSDGSCFCSPPLTEGIGSGETAEMWVAYPAPPPEVNSMTIVTPLTPPLLDVPISASSESLGNEGVSDPSILDLTIISDSLEDQTGRTENNEEVSIILSSDVLFETNSAELSPKAQEILEQVATEINAASSSLVNIDGHADNTGTESVNLPLSEERAESVEYALKTLVTRSGVTFDVKGYGSSEPIASNNTEEGRERNRRVSVTFAK